MMGQWEEEEQPADEEIKEILSGEGEEEEVERSVAHGCGGKIRL